MTAWRTKPVTELETTLQAESIEGPASQPWPLVTLHCGGTEAWAEDIAWLLRVYTNTEIYTPNDPTTVITTIGYLGKKHN